MLLRLAIGWHFFSEGTKKIVTNPATGETHLEVPTEMLFSRAVGPLEGFYKSQLPSFHDWQQLLAEPRQFKPLNAEQSAEAAKWQREYEDAKQAAAKEKKPAEIKFPPNAPYKAWAEQIVEDWRALLSEVVAVSGLSEEARLKAANRLQFRHGQLADYLAKESQAIAEWRHELWRMEKWEETAGADEIPFQQKRIDEKQAETVATGRAWVEQVKGIQRGLFNDWRMLPPAEERLDNPSLFAQLDETVSDDKATTLDRMNLAVTCLIIGVGVLLLLGLFTRVAAIGGIIFLLMVMATQPPWVEGASLQFFYYQLVELAALCVLIGTAAGRFAGLDFFLSKCCGGKKE